MSDTSSLAALLLGGLALQIVVLGIAGREFQKLRAEIMKRRDAHCDVELRVVTNADMSVSKYARPVWRGQP